MTKRVSDERLQECVDLSKKRLPVPDLDFQEFHAITSELAGYRAQLAAVTAQRDDLLRAARVVVDAYDRQDYYQEGIDKTLRSAIARAQPEQPQQPKEEP